MALSGGGGMLLMPLLRQAAASASRQATGAALIPLRDLSSAAAPAASQMSLIKELREKSGAPISDVKVRIRGVDGVALARLTDLSGLCS